MTRSDDDHLPTHNVLPAHCAARGVGIPFSAAWKRRPMTNEPMSLAATLIEVGELTESAKEDAINAMIQGRSDAPYLDPERGQMNANVSIEGFDDPDLSDEALDSLAAQNAMRAPDNDYDGEVAALDERIAAVCARLEEVTYNQVTGEPVHVLQNQGRKAALLQFRLLVRNRKIASLTSRHAESVRAERQALRDRDTNEKALRHAWTGSDPERVAMLDQELLKVEARELAEKIHKLRNS